MIHKTSFYLLQAFYHKACAYLFA